MKPPQRPTNRAECHNKARPCPWVSCRYHLFVDVIAQNGHLRRPHGKDLAALDTMPATCALDVANQGETSLEEVARHFRLTPLRVRKEELAALRKLRGVMTAFKKII